MKEIDDLEKGFVPNQEYRDAEKTKQMEIEFDEKGFEYAHNTNANISIFKNGLDSVYQFFLKEQKLDKEAIKTRIKTLNDRKEDFEKSSIEKSAEIEKAVIQNEKHQEDVEKYNNEVVGLKNEILEIKKKEHIIKSKVEINLSLTFLYDFHLHRSRLMFEKFIFFKFYPSVTSQHIIDQLLQNAFAQSVNDFQPFYFICFAEVQDLH